MARRGKSLAFNEDEIEDLLDLQYGEAQTFSLLTLLFSFVDLHNHFHVDHVFPQSRFSKNALRKVGILDGQIEKYQDRRDRIANLQLLAGAANIEKQDQLPAEWLQGMFPDTSHRVGYCEQHSLGEVPEGMDGFPEFYESRRSRLRAQVRNLLQQPAASASAVEGSMP